MDPEVLALLDQSKEAGAGETIRNVRCPRCGYTLLQAWGRMHAVVSVKCQKCKFSEQIDLALFRTMKQKKIEY